MIPGVSLDVIAWLQDMGSKLVPWRTVYDYERGVKWTNGKTFKHRKRKDGSVEIIPGMQLEPGVHWFWYFFQRIRTVAVQEQTINLPNQSATCADGIKVCFDVNVVYSVEDAVKNFCNVQHFEDSLRDLTMNHMFDRVSAERWEDLQKRENSKKLEGSISTTLQTRVRDWGARIERVGFSNLVPVEQYIRLFQDQTAGKVI